MTENERRAVEISAIMRSVAPKTEEKPAEKAEKEPEKKARKKKSQE